MNQTARMSMAFSTPFIHAPQIPENGLFHSNINFSTAICGSCFHMPVSQKKHGPANMQNVMPEAV